MSFNSWNQTLTASIADSTALASSTTATSILHPAAKFTLPAGIMQIGQKYRMIASGRMGTVVTTPGTLTFEVRLDGTTVVFGSGALALNVVAQTNATWYYEADLTVRAVGASTSGTIIGTGKFISRASLNAPAVGTTNGVGVVLLPDTAPAVGTGFDSTAAHTIDLFATWSVSNAANTILTHQYELILCN